MPDSVSPYRPLVASVAFVLPKKPKALGTAAFHGPLGEFARLIEPHTEASTEAVLMHFLAMFGSAAGRCRYFLVEADKHYPNLFVAIVGDTAKGRKGVAKGIALRRLESIAPEWASTCLHSGLSTDEGLIHHVRDRKTHVDEQGTEIVDDEGVSDKRCLACESELGGPMRRMHREGNSMSAVLRSAWDGETLQTLTKGSAQRATDAHIAIIGHITRAEAAEHINRTEAANGFANRFLWVFSERSKVLPFGGQMDEVDFRGLDRDLREALKFAQTPGRVRRDVEADDLWAQIYPSLSEGRAGLLGSVTSRAEAQVVRLSLLYAVLDCSDWILRPHLEAALELWRYAEESAAYIFGVSLGDPVADRIKAFLTSSGEATSTELRDHFNRHKHPELLSALRSLVDAGVVEQSMRATPGRHATVWRLRQHRSDQSDRSPANGQAPPTAPEPDPWDPGEPLL